MDKLEELISRYPALSVCKSDIRSALEALVSSVRAGGTILLCGNGGSAADCEHIAGELLKGFLSRRKMSDCTAAKFRSALGDGATEADIWLVLEGGG